MRVRRIRALMAIGAALVLAAVLVATATSGAQPPHQSPKAPQRVDAYVTYYGWYDNTPPGCATAYSGCARGLGTYRHPITFASYRKEFPVGTLIYYPTLRKYFRMGDECQECQADWTGKGPDGGPHLHHVDLWIGGKGGNEFDAINCEDALTQGPLTSLIVHPRPGLPVSTKLLFDAKTGRCLGGRKAATSHAQYKNEATGECLAPANNSTKPGTPAVTAPCGKAAAEDLAYTGAFFVVNQLCLATDGVKLGARLDFVSCSGGPRQQWETGAHGTIAWIQYLKCIADVHGAVKLASCKRSNSDRANRWKAVPEPKR